MIRRTFNILTVAFAIFFGVLVILAVPSFFDPAFEVVNTTTQPVFVVAEWRNEEKELGNIAPMSSYEFSINDEAAMKFRARYPRGAETESEPIYFTSGVQVIATITSDAIKVRYDHESATYDMFDASGLYEGQGGGANLTLNGIEEPVDKR